VFEIITKIMINATPSEVWKVVSEIDNDSQFWKGIAKVRNTSKNGNVLNREIILKNSDKCSQKIILFPMEGIHIKWTKDTINGIKDIMITPMGSQTLLRVEMNYKVSGIESLLPRYVSEELLDEAELALQLIKNQVEKKNLSQLSQEQEMSQVNK
jgi:hypothetical protein